MQLCRRASSRICLFLGHAGECQACQALLGARVLSRRWQGAQQTFAA